MWDDLLLIKDFVFTTLDRVIVLYFSGGLLTLSFAIFIVRKVSTLIDKLR